MDVDVDENHRARPYQEELLEIALKENVIIYLPTGAGKTFIALMAMKHFSKDLDGTIKDGAKRTAFLCNTVALAKQQHDVIRKQTNLKVAVYTGDLNVDNWKRDRWDVEIDKHQVFVATTQIILDVVRHGFIKIEHFNLLIFDECHSAKGGHAMYQLLQLFQYTPESKLPRVIGLTGLLIISPTKRTLLKELMDLEAIFRAKITTVSDFEKFKNVLLYSTKPEEIMISYNDMNPIKPRICTIVEELIYLVIKKIDNWEVDGTHLKLTKNLSALAQINPIKKLKNLLHDFVYQMENMGVYGASIAIMSVIVELELKKRAAETIQMRNLYRLCITCAERIRHILVKVLYDDDDDDDEEDNEDDCTNKENEKNRILLNSSPKVQKLLLYLKSTFADKKYSEISCLLFVDRRLTAKNLYHLINRYISVEKLPIKPEFMVGRHSTLVQNIESILDDKWNKNVLNDFKRNECNLIVASSVLEEGIDVQSCNYVIVYDPIKSFRSYVQTKGRARMENSTYCVIVPESIKAKMLTQIQEYREMDKMLKDFLIGKTLDRKAPPIEQTNAQFHTHIDPFVTPIGARLEADSAVHLLNRYCMGLPCDSYTISTAEWGKVDYVQPGKFTKIIAKLRLPLQSTIKDDIYSDAMDNASLAKKSAAFKACKQLYNNGELNDNLLPITSKYRIESVKDLYFKHWDKYPSDNPRTAGTKKNKREYSIEYPPQLVSAMPQVHTRMYLYIITITPEFERNEDNSHIVELLGTKEQYAIATIKPLPKLGGMPLFMSDGRVRAQIAYEPVRYEISSNDELQLLRNFHVMLFRDVLRIWKDFFAYDYRNEKNSFLIVPMRNDSEIDWNLVRKFQSLPPARELAELERARVKYVAGDFQNCVINTWYSVDDKMRYVVLKVREELSPQSPFPNEQFPTFASYAEEKYKVRVVQKNQFLLEVKPLTLRLNFLSPGGGEDGSKKKNKKLDDILLIPELCHNFRFPGNLWLKASFLPSILHRLHYLLLAEQLRVNINAYLRLEFPNYVPKDLIVDTTLKRLEDTKPIKQIQAPVYPNPKETVAKPVTEVCTLVENTLLKWKPYEEPCDLNRYLDKVYKIELDYYHQFITNKLESIHIGEPIETLSAPSNRLAICDVPTVEKLRINILEIDEDTIVSPEQSDFLSSITAASSNDVFDMERVELLGDSFLKLSASLYLILKHPTWNEGHLTTVKGQFVSNRNLLYHAIELKLPGALNVNSFKPRDDWQPPLLDVPINAKELIIRDNISPSVLWELKLDDDEVVSGQCKDKTLMDFIGHFSQHTVEFNDSDLNIFKGSKIVSDKVCADSVEAILGTCVKSYGIQKTFSMLNFLNICRKDEDVSNLLNVNLGNPRLRTNITDKEVNEFLLNCNDLEKSLGYKFNDRAYLLQALTHPSFPTNRLTGCYQQLEFLGDALLDFLISCYIFERCTHMDPGKLTDLRSALVNNVTLACLTVRHKIHLFMLYQNASLSQAILKFVDFQETQDYRVTDQCRILVDETNAAPSMADYVDVPKALGDVFEALVGAVFLDSNNNLKKTWNFIYGLMYQEIDDFMRDVPIQVVRKLHEYHGAGPAFSDPIVDEDVVMIKCKFTCRNEIQEVCGFGKNKEQAKISAAKIALQILSQA